GEARAGYRHGTRSRTLTTSLGPTTITMPRARLATDDGGMTEWASAAVPRYQRRTARVDEAILGVYLSGGNTRRLKGALAPPLRTQWPGVAIQRCTVHKLRNLQAKAPARLREEIAEDYRRMIYGETREAVEKARAAFTKKWRLRCAPVVASLEEAGDELFTFLRFPVAQWKALRTTNALERINEEFRRRTKTQGLLPSEDAVLLLLFGLLRTGQIKLRRLDGWQEIPHSVPITGKAASRAARTTTAQPCRMMPSDIFYHLTDTAGARRPRLSGVPRPRQSPP